MKVNKKHARTIPFFTLSREYAKYKKEINKAITSVLTTQQFVLGEQVRLFEKEFASYLNVRYVVGVNSGTDGLMLALLALGVGPGDEVITQANSFVATATAIRAVGATPILVDVDQETFQINIFEVQKKISKKTKAIIPVHLYGASSEIEKITKLAKKHKIFVIEDACQAHGSGYKTQKLGTFGEIGVFSFYPSKNLGAYGDGGAVVTNNKKLYQLLYMARNHGQEKKYIHKTYGINSRLDELQAAVLRVKLKYLDQHNLARQMLARRYVELLRGVKTQHILPNSVSNYYLFVITHTKRDALQRYLTSLGIGTLIHYPIPIHLLDSFKYLGYGSGDFPMSEKLAKTCLSLPLFFGMTRDEVTFVSQALLSFQKSS